MSRGFNDFSRYSQISIEELKERASSSITKAGKKGKNYEPVQVSGRKICQHWWGQAWCENLEQYADYASRIDRGKRYVRSGAVVDLQIQNGKIEAKVQGSQRAPYKVEIMISPLSKERCQEIEEKCGKRIANMESLIQGDFPDEMKELFIGEKGLFPTPREIYFHCSCPDWAVMCKHVAAAMYGIGVKVDQNPFYFFRLRGIDVESFIRVAVANKVESMLANAELPSKRILETEDVTDLFGVL